jgi:sulfide:quinone oxidoreductase
MASILILGGGFGGLAAAHELRARLPDNHDVTVVAAADHFYTGFAKLWDLVGTRPLEQGTASLSALERHGIRFVQTRITAIDPVERRVETEAGSLGADFLLVALGASPGPKQLLQLHGPAHNLYDANELPEVRADLAHLDVGTLVVAVLGAPYKCPPAPYEATLLLDEHLRGRGVRDSIELMVTTPQSITLPAAGPEISQFVADALKDSPMVDSLNTRCCWRCLRRSHRRSSPRARWLAKEAGFSPSARPCAPASRRSTQPEIARHLLRRRQGSSSKLRPASPHAI